MTTRLHSFIMDQVIFIWISVLFQDIGSKATDFNYVSGLYTVNLIIGDVILTNPFSWNLADVKLKLSDQPVQTKQSLYDPKPEIQVIYMLTLFEYNSLIFQLCFK